MNNKPVLFNEKSECCGCSACKSVCPFGCIRMIDDEMGFKYPEIDYGNCVGCMKCIRVCPLK